MGDHDVPDPKPMPPPYNQQQQQPLSVQPQMVQQQPQMMQQQPQMVMQQQPQMMMQQQPQMVMQQPQMMQQQPQMMQQGQPNVYVVQQPAPGGAPAPPPGVTVVAPPVVAPIPGVPRGLEYLSSLDQILVKQQVEVLEMITGFETCNKYKVLNSMGQPMYFAKEETDCLTRQCCGPARPFDIEIRDNFDQEIIHLNRGLRCDSCCFPCCLQKMEVSSPPGNIIGTVEQEWSILFPQFVLKDAAGNDILRIKGPFCTCSCCGTDVEFEVLSLDGDNVGKISKQWSGFAREAITDSDNFGASFPVDLDAKAKALVLGAIFLIDFMFFEKSDNQRNDGVGMLS